MLQDVPFSGQLLLEQTPAPEVLEAAPGLPVLFTVLLAGFLLAALLSLPRFMDLVPLLLDSLFRARGSVSLESSARYGHDRRLMATLLLVPASLLIYYYRLWNPAFLQDAPEGWRLAWICGAVGAYCLLRRIMSLLLRPRRRQENYRIADNLGLTWFIVLGVLALVTVGVLVLFRAADPAIATVLKVESALLYLVFFIRKAQIFLLSCNGLRTFLYLCGLEILPTAALVISATAL